MGRLLGLDLGTRTCGIAVSDPMGIIASGYENYRFRENDFENALMHIKEVCDKMNIEKIIIGLPKHMNGDLGEKCELVLAFKEKLEKLTNLEVITVDERWTTVIANRRLLDADLSRKKRKEVIDKMAAVEILQGYFCARNEQKYPQFLQK